MAHVQDLWKTVDGRRVGTSRYGKGTAGRLDTSALKTGSAPRTFACKQDVERFVVTVGADVLRGAVADYLVHADPGFTLRVYATCSRRQRSARKAVDRPFDTSQAPGAAR